jgi:hypothetical protein
VPTISNVTFVPTSGVLKIGDSATITVTSDGTGYSAGTIQVNGVDVSATLSDNLDNTYDLTYTVVEGHTDILDSENIPISITLIDPAGNNSTAYTATDINNRPGVDGHTPTISNVTFVPTSGVLKIGDSATITVTSDGTGYSAGTIQVNGVDVSATLSDNLDNTYDLTYTVVEGHTDILDSENIPISITLIDPAGNNSTAYTATDINNRPGVDGHVPTTPGNLTLNHKTNLSVTLNFGIPTVESNFLEYKIFYKEGTSGVTESDTEYNSGDDFNLSSINYNGAATTTIEGLTEGVDYVFNIWAYDIAGNKTSATEINIMTDYVPSSPSGLTQYKNDEITEIVNDDWTNESNIKLQASATDGDNPETLRIYFEVLTDAGTFTTATSEPASSCTSGTAFASCGDGIWFVESASGDYTVSPFVATANITGLLESASGYKWQAIACGLSGVCSEWSSFGTSPNFKVDTINPSAPGNLVFNSQTPTEVTFDFGSQGSDLNFSEYKIFYKVGSSGVTVNDLEFNSLDDPNLAFVDYNGASTITVNNLSAGTTYVFNIWTYDSAGNYAGATELSATTPSASNPPISIFNSAAQKIDGSGAVDISIEVDDLDNDDTLRSQIEYVAGATCDFTIPLDPTLDETDGNITADYGDPDIDNNSTHQVGTSTSWIMTSPGSNTVNFDWLSPLDETSPNNIYCLRLLTNDGTFDELSYSTTTVLIDNVSPSTPGNLALNTRDTYGIILNLGATSTDANFSHYKIFYKEGTSGVAETDIEHIDVNLADQNFNGANSTTISGLSEGLDYVFNIWAYDIYGNKTSATEITVSTNNIPASPTTLTQYKNDGTTQIINSAWTEESNVKLQARVLDGDTSEVLTLYFELATSTDSFTNATTSSCAFNDDFLTCSSKVWSITSSAGDYSVTPFTAAVNPQNIPDSSVGYKWQVMACDDDNVCSSWSDFGVDPNFKIDNTIPSTPGALTLNSRNQNSVTLNFGSASTENNFTEYKIFYKEGISGVTELDSMHASSTDPNLGFIDYNSAVTTNISGLNSFTDYVFNIWAYDEAGNKASSTEFTITTNAPPTSNILSLAERTNGTGIVDIFVEFDDSNNDNLRAKVEYVTGIDCNFASPLDPTLDETDANATSTFGDAKIDDSNTYQIGTSTGWIETTSGANTVSFDWFSQTDLADGDGTYCIRVTAYDGEDIQISPATSTLVIDNLAPSIPGDLTYNSRTGDSLTLNYNATSSDSNFSLYKIYYKLGAATVSENDLEHSDTNLLDIDFNGAPTTTVGSLLENSQYSFRIYAYDNFGNKSNSGQTTFTTNARPSGVFNSIAQKINGSGIIDISIEVYDANGDVATARLDYVLGATCDFGVPLDPTLDETQTNISSDYGTVGIENDNIYQIGTSTGIITSSGSNTINFDWPTQAQLPGADGVYCMQLTVNDGIDDQAVSATSTVYIDNANPTAPGNLGVESVTGFSVVLNFGSASADSNFSEYKIFYKKAVSGVTENDLEFNQYNDLDLGFIDYNGTASTSIVNLSQNSDYVFNIWVYDSYGNKSQAITEVSTTTTIILSATWRENEDVNDPTVAVPIGREEPIRLRLSMANTGDVDMSAYSFELEYGIKETTCSNISTWIDIPDTASFEHLEMVDSVYFIDQSPTTEQLLNEEAYSFVSGSMVENPGSTSSLIDLAAGDYTEMEYAFQPSIYSSAGNVYCFRLTNEGTPVEIYNRYPELTLAPPTNAWFNSAVQKTDGTGIVDISIDVEDAGGDLNQAKIEYVSGLDCNFASPLDPTLDENLINIIADFGQPAIDNNYPYQVGTSSGMIVTAAGANTVNFDWTTNLDIPLADGDYCLQLTTFDSFEEQVLPATTTLTIDNIDPTIPGNLFEVAKTSNSITLGLSTTTFDTNFSDYRIYYKEGSSGVTESDNLWASTSDSNLAFINYNGATTTTITGLLTNHQYVFRIWAYDSFGNKAVSNTEVTVIIKYQAQTEDWQWYHDEQNETPTTSAASLNTSPNDITDGGTIKLRLAIREIEGITGDNVKVRLEYSTFSDFSSDVNFVGEIGSISAWTYGDGVDEDNDVISTTTIPGVIIGGTHNESGISTTTYDLPAGDIGEWEFTIRNNGATNFVTYYFRAYDNNALEAIAKGSLNTYPSLITTVGSIDYSVTGFSSGGSTEGITANISTTPSSIPFGTLAPGADSIGVQRFNISTNAGTGYQLFVYYTQDLISNSGDLIEPVSAINSAPASWPLLPDPSAFGYHTGDDTLSGVSPSRFSPNNTYAQLSISMEEVSYSHIPVTNEEVDMVYRTNITENQAAGDYETSIVYILVPAFY